MQLTEGVEAEFAITNSLGIRADFERGPLTIEQMFNVIEDQQQLLLAQRVQERSTWIAALQW